MTNRILLALILTSYLLCAFASAGEVRVRGGGAESESEAVAMEVEKGMVSMDVKNAKIADVLTELAQASRISLTIDQGFEERISIRLKDVTVEQALQQLCRNRALVFEYDSERKAYRVLSGSACAGSDEKDEVRGEVASMTSTASQPGPGSARTDENSAPDPISNQGPGRVFDTRGRPLYKAGELLVRFKDEATPAQIDALHRSLGSRVFGAVSRLKLERVKLKEGLSEDKGAELYSASDLVESVEKHALRYGNTTPDDPYFGEQWGLSHIQAPEAWDISQGSPEIIIAVIDTGVDYLHPDLSDNIWTNTAELNGTPDFDDDGNGYIDDIYGWDFAGTGEDANDPDADPRDVNGHGTHVAGIIAAAGNNGRGIAGVCWQAKIMVLKVQADDGEELADIDVINALYYALDNGAQIVNCSFGGQARNQSEYDTFADLQEAGMLAVCAAGNEDIDSDRIKNYPSSFNLDNIISVAASDQADHLAEFPFGGGSNWGAKTVDVMAPGLEIESTIPPAIYTQARVTLEGDTSTVVYTAFGMDYAGTTDDDGITAPLYDCGLGNAPGRKPQGDFPPGVDGYIALIQRDRVVTFAQKTTNAQEAGAIAVIIYNNTTDEEPDDTINFRGTLGGPGDWVPVVSINNRDGEDLKARGLLEPVTVVNRPDDSPSFYGKKNGTSMATPHVAGIAGLLLSVHPGLDHGGLKAVILGTVDEVDPIDPNDDGKQILTNGRVNAETALLHAYLPADVSANNTVGLEDAILGLQVMGDQDLHVSPLGVMLGVDVNEDARIGIEEVIYALRRATGLSE